MMMMMNCCCGMVDRRKAFSLISSQDHCQRSSPLWISDTPQAGFEPAQSLGSGLSWMKLCSSANHYTTDRQRNLRKKFLPDFLVISNLLLKTLTGSVKWDAFTWLFFLAPTFSPFFNVLILSKLKFSKLILFWVSHQIHLRHFMGFHMRLCLLNQI